MSFVGRLARPTLATAAVAVGYSAYVAEPIRADSLASRSDFEAQPGRKVTEEKLPIYPAETQPLITLVEVENPITPYVAQARIATTNALSSTSGYIREGVNRWINFERKAEREIKSILPADESLTPGIIYVLIAGLSGSVLTRTRLFPIRLLTPPLFTLAAMPYFLPKTAHNLREYISEVEDKHFPEFAQKHDIFNSRLSMHWEMLKDKVGSAEETAGGWGEKAVRGFENSTGLKVGEAIRHGQEKVQRQKEKLQGGVRVGEEPVKVETVGYVVETRPVAQIIAPVTPGAPSGLLNAKAAVDRPTIIPAAAAEPAVAEAVAPSNPSPASSVAPVSESLKSSAGASKAVETKPEENKRLV